MEQVTSLVGFLAWPIIVLVIILIFRVEIKNLMTRLRTADWSKKAIEFGEGSTDVRPVPLKTNSEPEPVEERSKVQIRLSVKPATLFWIANDLMWVQDMLFRNATREDILAGMGVIRAYLNDLGLGDTNFADELRLLARHLEPPLYLLGDLPATERNYLASEIEKVKLDLAGRVQEEQPGFEKLRVFPTIRG